MNQCLDELYSLTINGAQQWLLCRSQKTSNPVVLFIHGGPGSPLMWFSRAFDSCFLENFSVVHWDQRGAGKSFDSQASLAALTLDQLVLDGIQVAKHLKTKFDCEKIIIVGHSWGSILGAHMAAAASENFLALVSAGSVGDVEKTENFRLLLLKQKIANSKDKVALLDLLDLGRAPYREIHQQKVFQELFMRFNGFGGTFHGQSVEQINHAVSKNQEYTTEEMAAADRAKEYSFTQFLSYLNSYKASQVVKKLDVPVIFAQGKYDLHTPPQFAAEYFEALKALRGKKWYWFEDSAHFPFYEQPLKFLELLKSCLAPSA